MTYLIAIYLAYALTMMRKYQDGIEQYHKASRVYASLPSHLDIN